MKLKGVKSFIFPVTRKIQNLPDFACAAVKLSVSNSVDDGADLKLESESKGIYEADNYEIYWGFAGSPVHQIFPTQTSDYIYVGDLSDISVRCNKNNAEGTQLNISVFVEI